MKIHIALSFASAAAFSRPTFVSRRPTFLATAEVKVNPWFHKDLSKQSGIEFLEECFESALDFVEEQERQDKESFEELETNKKYIKFTMEKLEELKERIPRE